MCFQNRLRSNDVSSLTTPTGRRSLSRSLVICECLQTGPLAAWFSANHSQRRLTSDPLLHPTLLLYCGIYTILWWFDVCIHTEWWIHSYSTFHGYFSEYHGFTMVYDQKHGIYILFVLKNHDKAKKYHGTSYMYHSVLFYHCLLL